MINKLSRLGGYLKNKNLNKEYLYLKKIAQSEPDLFEEDEEDFGRGMEDWLKGLPRNELILTSPQMISGVRDTSGSCSTAWKPVGLWYASGTDWIEYLTYNMPDWISKVNYVYKIKPKYSSGLDGSGGVLKLSTEEEVRDFSEQFGISRYGRGIDYVDWGSVSKIWDGIEIIPYQDSLRMDSATDWYYAWDIASGCIWRPSGASELELIRTRPGL